MIDLGALAADPLLVVHADCVEAMRSMPEASVDAVVTDPPYGLEFMGKEWDKAGADAWRTGGGFTKPGIGERRTPWADFGGRDTSNPTCATCGGRRRGARRCECAEPEWRVKGESLDLGAAAGKAREQQAWHEAWAREALRVLRPGGYMLAFGGTRTFHRMTCAIEDAGFVVRDCLSWLYGSGFPKSLDVSKAFDRAAGAAREVVGVKPGHEAFVDRTDAHSGGGDAEGWDRPWKDDPDAVRASHMATAPATDLAKRWDGWGTALKPAWEPIILAQRPLVGTYIGNLERHGVGALNIEGSRIGTEDMTESRMTQRPGGVLNANGRDVLNGNWRQKPNDNPASHVGRWPANVLLDKGAAAMLDAQTGDLGVSAGGQIGKTSEQGGEVYEGGWASARRGDPGYGDRGGASRFFYVAKASRGDRGRGNSHPTVKPVELMRHLMRLVTPPGGLVLDPFAGSGTTGQAALAEGYRCVLIEREEEYVRGIREWRGAMQIGLGLDV